MSVFLFKCFGLWVVGSSVHLWEEVGAKSLIWWLCVELFLCGMNLSVLMRIFPMRRCRGRSRWSGSAGSPVRSNSGSTRASPRLRWSSRRGPTTNFATGIRMQRRRRRRSVFIFRISFTNHLWLLFLVIFWWCTSWWWTCSGWFWWCSSDAVCLSSGLVARWSRRRWVIFAC